MISDATLAAYEKNGSPSELLLVKEIRRQREVYESGLRRFREAEMERDGARVDASLLCYALKESEEALAAHQAMVRELADLLDVDAVPEFANEGDMVVWVERKNAALGQPLVVAARTVP